MTEGWTYILGSTRWHYFRNGMSLCGKFPLPKGQHLEKCDDLNPFNCAKCRNERIKEREKTT